LKTTKQRTQLLIATTANTNHNHKNNIIENSLAKNTAKHAKHNPK
jgi:hypothetical protein